MAQEKQYSGFWLSSGKVTGGYRVDEPNGFTSVDFVDARKIIGMAELYGQSVHLAGNWSHSGKIGFGETVSPFEAWELVKKV